MGTLQSGETIVSIAFEIGGKLTQPIGQVKLTLPAEVLEGYTLSLLAEDGTEAELTDVQDGSFVLDFSGASSPVRVIRSGAPGGIRQPPPPGDHNPQSKDR